jgi:branched-chain amino acid transport system substrate-binding protein
MKNFYRNLIIMITVVPMLVLSVNAPNEKITAATPTINIGILFPKYTPQGGGGFNGKGGMVDGAELAAQEINAAGGINVGGTRYTIQLDFQDEGSFDLSHPPGYYNTQITDISMSEMLGTDQFIIGGFRTETTTEALGKLALWNSGHTETPVPFFICGAPDDMLINPSPPGQWVFRDTPVNNTMLFYTIADYIREYLGPKLASIYTNSTWPPATPGKVRFAVVCESYTWTQPLWYLFTAPAGTPTAGLPPSFGGVTPGYNYFLGPQLTTSGVFQSAGYPYPGDCVIDPLASASDIQTLVNTLKSEDVHLIITAFTMSEVNTLLADIATIGMPAMVVGIDVPGQTQQHWADTGGSTTTLATCNDEVCLCYSGTATPIVPGDSANFWNDFVKFTGGYWPMYTAEGAYDALYGLKLNIENAGTADAKNPALLAAIEATNWTTPSGQFMYTSNDIYCNSTDVTWPPLDGQAYGYVRSQVIQWVQNKTAPAAPNPFVGAQMNVVSPTDQLYSRRTQIPPTMYPLADAGDINLDGKVSLADLVSLAHSYGSKPGTAAWNSNADIDNNGIVGLSDLVQLASHYGQSAPQWPLP